MKPNLAQRGKNMAIPKRNIRGLQDLRTLSGSVDQAATVPYKAYMRLTSLEIEKFRRKAERESAMHRVRNIDARFREIEAEKDTLLRALSERTCGNPTDTSNTKSKSVPSHSTGRFRIKY